MKKRKKTKVQCSRRVTLTNKTSEVSELERAEYAEKFEKLFKQPIFKNFNEKSNKHEFYFELCGIEVDVYDELEDVGFVSFTLKNKNLDKTLCEGYCRFSEAMDNIINALSEHKEYLENLKKSIKVSHMGITMISDKIAKAFLESGIEMTKSEKKKKEKAEVYHLEDIWEQSEEDL